MLVSKESAIFLSGICRCRENIVLALRLKGEGGGGTGRFFSHYITVNKKTLKITASNLFRKKRILGIFRHQKGMKQNHFCKTVEIAYRMVLKPSHLQFG